LRKNRLPVPVYTKGILSGDRLLLSRAITLVESQLAEDQALAQEVMAAVLPHTGKSVRVGITGVPGVGKSTFIEVFGKCLTDAGRKIAVLAVDPSSQRSKGSIMGDKTRMETLSHDPLAYIRPSPAGHSLGGVTRKTREAMLLCEAAGFEVVIVETVGVGQSETAVRAMVDFFLLLMLAGAGDELQGMKKGIMEMADAIAITKADGDNAQRAGLAQAEYQNALHLFPPSGNGWEARVLTCSALENQGIAPLWQLIEAHRRLTQQNGFFARNRQEQQLHWMHETVQQTLQEHFYNHPSVKSVLGQVEADVRASKIPATQAALQLLKQYEK
jgi:LAO/AO transport system kinase